jgi:hypothetical protein
MNLSRIATATAALALAAPAAAHATTPAAHTDATIRVLAIDVPARQAAKLPACATGEKLVDVDVAGALAAIPTVRRPHARGLVWTARGFRVVYDRKRALVRNVGLAPATVRAYCLARTQAPATRTEQGAAPIDPDHVDTTPDAIVDAHPAETLDAVVLPRPAVAPAS